MTSTRRRRTLAGGIASLTVAGAVTGGVVAVHSSHASAADPAAQAGASITASPSPTLASPAAKPHHRHRAATPGLVARVQSVTATSLIVVDAQGATHTLTLAPKVKVTGPAGAETPASLPPGELVLISVKSAHAARAGASPPAATSSGAATTTGDVAVEIRDTGFKAA